MKSQKNKLSKLNQNILSLFFPGAIFILVAEYFSYLRNRSLWVMMLTVHPKLEENPTYLKGMEIARQSFVVESVLLLLFYLFVLVKLFQGFHQRNENVR